jgi:hypothetical protein
LLKVQKTKPFSGRPASARDGVGTASRPVVSAGKIAVRQPDDLFREEAFCFGRDQTRVGDDVVDVVRTQRSGIAEIVDRDRHGAERQGCRAAPFDIARKVDGDIDLQRRQQFGDFLIGARTGVDEMLEGAFQALPNRAVGSRPQTDAEGLESRPVVALEQFDGLMAGGMVVEVRRQISDAQTLAGRPACCA